MKPVKVNRKLAINGNLRLTIKGGYIFVEIWKLQIHWKALSLLLSLSESFTNIKFCVCLFNILLSYVWILLLSKDA